MFYYDRFLYLVWPTIIPHNGGKFKRLNSTKKGSKAGPSRGPSHSGLIIHSDTLKKKKGTKSSKIAAVSPAKGRAKKRIPKEVPPEKEMELK